jgi:hypothetical protein
MANLQAISKIFEGLYIEAVSCRWFQYDDLRFGRYDRFILLGTKKDNGYHHTNQSTGCGHPQ